MAGDCFHRHHAVAEQQQIGIVQADAAIEGLAQPVVHRIGQADAMTRLGHGRAANQRVAGPIDLFRQHVRPTHAPLARHPRTHDADVTGSLAGIDLA